jgi:hypothetical protein
MLSAILQKLTGEKLIDYLRPRLFQPLGITGATWESCPMGINTGGFGLAIKTEDIARFGQLYLQKGVWGGQQLVPAEWVAKATSQQISNLSDAATAPSSDWQQGYGYQFWRCRHNAYRGDGAFGQYCIVLPEQDAVLAITSGIEDMQLPLNAVWETLLPAFQPAALPPDPQTQALLRDRLAGLCLCPPESALPVPAAWLGASRRYTMQPNAAGVEAMRFDFHGDQGELLVETARGSERIPFGLGAWRPGQTTLFGREPQTVVSSLAWSAPETGVLTIRAYKTPFFYTLSCHFSGAELAVDGAVNVAFGPKQLPALSGRMELEK